MIDKQMLLKEWKRWRINALEDYDLICEMEKIENLKDNFEDEMYDRYYKQLEFGTGGIRGEMGVGINRINIYTIARATLGYVQYLKSHRGKRVAIAYDSRIKSKLFARIAAEVFAAEGINVYIFSEIMPTPVLSYAIRCLQSDGGVVITASHNPPEYNGYKVYDKDGGQITQRMAAAIFDNIQKIDIFDDICKLSFDEALAQKKIQYIDDSLVGQYLHIVSQEALEEKKDKDIPIIYTPLNGTGKRLVQDVLHLNGFMNVTMVEEQSEPDGLFPTCPFPNPEIEEAFKLGVEYAKKTAAELVIATDPDCDRVGVAVLSNEGYKHLSGNEIGILLLDYICKRRIELDNMPNKPICMKTIVTTDLVYRIADSYGVEVRDLLTGFKYIGEQITLLEKAGEEKRFILGLEESYGYLSGTYVRDKDGVNASLLLADMVSYYKKYHKGLMDVLEEIYDKYGYWLEQQNTYLFKGAVGKVQMEKIMARIRRDMVKDDGFVGKKVKAAIDYQQQMMYLSDGKNIGTDLPASAVCKIVWEDGNSIVIRPSGTEPKLKLYLSTIGKNRESAESNIAQLSEKMKKYIYNE